MSATKIMVEVARLYDINCAHWIDVVRDVRSITSNAVVGMDREMNSEVRPVNHSELIAYLEDAMQKADEVATRAYQRSVVAREESERATLILKAATEDLQRAIAELRRAREGEKDGVD